MRHKSHPRTSECGCFAYVKLPGKREVSKSFENAEAVVCSKLREASCSMQHWLHFLMVQKQEVLPLNPKKRDASPRVCILSRYSRGFPPAQHDRRVRYYEIIPAADQGLRYETGPWRVHSPSAPYYLGMSQILRNIFFRTRTRRTLH